MKSNIRNFAIIAHIDAGKSTLADRLIELTSPKAILTKQQFLDSNPIEQERGITIKLAPITMYYSFLESSYTLNLIDTPGHADFSYEVERALSACEGAILLVDATQGVQAQTISHLKLARDLNLTIIPVINKIDSPLANLDLCFEQLSSLFPNADIPLISAKTGQGVTELLQIVIQKFPPPPTPKNNLQISIFNSIYDTHLGAVAFVKIISGELSSNNILLSKGTGHHIPIKELGIFTLDSSSPVSSKIIRKKLVTLSAGSVGFIATGLKDTSKILIGDTLVDKQRDEHTPALPGFRKLQSNIFLNIFPEDRDQTKALSTSLAKLKLSDSSLSIDPTNSPLLGNGFRMGFLGILHSDVIIERIKREFGISVIATSPTVKYRFFLKNKNILSVTSAEDFPDPSLVDKAQEPITKLQIITPDEYIGKVMELSQQSRGDFKDLSFIGKSAKLTYHMPLIEVITHFYDALKSVSSGFASLDYQPTGWIDSDLVKLTVLLNQELIPQLSLITTRQQAQTKAHNLAEKLSQLIPRHQFEIPIQVTLGGKILARKTIKAFRKDVTAKLYGGDATRRMKLLQKQKKGKKKMKQLGKVNLPPEVFLATL